MILSDFLSMTTITLFEVNAILSFKSDINMCDFNKEEGMLKRILLMNTLFVLESFSSIYAYLYQSNSNRSLNIAIWWEC